MKCSEKGNTRIYIVINTLLIDKHVFTGLGFANIA